MAHSFSYGDIRLGQGRENAKEFLHQNVDLSAEIELAVRSVLSVEIFHFHSLEALMMAAEKTNHL